MTEPLPLWMDKLRGKERDALPVEIVARFAKKRCPRCDTADVLVNGLGVYICVAEECVHPVSPLHGIALWWKFDPARDGGKGKDHASRLPHKPGWVHGTRMVVRQTADQVWIPRPDDGSPEANTWDTPKRRKAR